MEAVRTSPSPETPDPDIGSVVEQGRTPVPRTEQDARREEIRRAVARTMRRQRHAQVDQMARRARG